MVDNVDIFVVFTEFQQVITISYELTDRLVLIFYIEVMSKSENTNER